MDYMNKFENNTRNIQLSTPYSIFQEKTKTTPINNLRYENENYKQNSRNDKSINFGIGQRKLIHSQSMGDFSMRRRREITNPEFFYEHNSEDFQKYRMEQKKYLDYNYYVMMNNKNRFKRNEPNVNPYHPYRDDFENCKSDLQNNLILNPVNSYYSNNKLFQSNYERNNFGKCGNNIIMNNNNNIHSLNINKVIFDKKKFFS